MSIKSMIPSMNEAVKIVVVVVVLTVTGIGAAIATKVSGIIKR